MSKSRGTYGVAGRGNRNMYDAMSELRRSSAASPHQSAKAYVRKPKHVKQGWSE